MVGSPSDSFCVTLTSRTDCKAAIIVSTNSGWHIAVIDKALYSFVRVDIHITTNQVHHNIQIAVHVYSCFLSFSARKYVTLHQLVLTMCTYISFWNPSLRRAVMDSNDDGAVVGSKNVGAEEIIFINLDFTPTHYSSICLIPHPMLMMRCTIHPLALPSLAFNPSYMLYTRQSLALALIAYQWC